MLVSEARAALGQAVPVVSQLPGISTPTSGSSASPTSPTAPLPMPNGGRYAKYAGKLGCALTVGISAAIIRRGGREPNEPDDSDTKMLEDALEEGIRLQYGDANIPWWLGSMLAAGGVYASMRVGAPKSVREADLQAAAPQETAQEAPPSEPQQTEFSGLFAAPVVRKD